MIKKLYFKIELINFKVVFMENEFYRTFIRNLEKELPNEPDLVNKIADLIERNKFTKKEYLNLINEEVGD